MSDTVKLIIEIPKEYHDKLKFLVHERGVSFCPYVVIANGTPLDNVKAEIEQNAYPIVYGVNNHEKGMTLYGILQVLDNIGKESEDNQSDKT